MKAKMKLKNYSKTKREIQQEGVTKEIEVELYLWQYKAKNMHLTLYVVIFQCEEFVISIMEHIMVIQPARLG